MSVPSWGWSSASSSAAFLLPRSFLRGGLQYHNIIISIPNNVDTNHPTERILNKHKELTDFHRMWQQGITWANVDPDLCPHMMSLGHNELRLHHINIVMAQCKTVVTRLPFISTYSSSSSELSDSSLESSWLSSPKCSSSDSSFSLSDASSPSPELLPFAWGETSSSLPPPKVATTSSSS